MPLYRGRDLTILLQCTNIFLYSVRDICGRTKSTESIGLELWMLALGGDHELT